MIQFLKRLLKTLSYSRSECFLVRHVNKLNKEVEELKSEQSSSDIAFLTRIRELESINAYILVDNDRLINENKALTENIETLNLELLSHQAALISLKNDSKKPDKLTVLINETAYNKPKTKKNKKEKLCKA